ncbi:ribosome biogenesis GTPase Der [Oligoflexia bacterium]|nr:ribosome biogenesis GTPase Der [Oligoflexia bacterium]
MNRRPPLIAVVGRTNVGKSTLLTAIAGRRIAIVKDTPGVTRDRSYAHITKYEFPFTLVDTGGLVGEEDCLFHSHVSEQARLAIAEADLVLAVFDGLTGLHPQDKEVVSLLRRAKKKVLWVINKCEKPSTAENAVEFYNLGLEEYRCVSSAHNIGVHALVKDIRNNVEALVDDDTEECEQTDDASIRVAVLGRPNVGKSTFVNKVLGQERVIASEHSGTTRDSIDITLQRDGVQFTLVDTAGLRKKAQIKDQSVERFGNLRALRSLAQCNVAVLLLDASQGPPSEQDTKIAGLIHDRGIPFMFVVNKWDIVEKDHRSAKAYKDEIKDIFKFARYAPILFVSALTGRRCPSVLTKAAALYNISQTRIQTADINKLLERAFTKKPPPVYRGEPIKFYFCTQIAVAPPTIVIFANHPQKLPVSYQRYIINSIRKEFPFEGSNIKLIFKKKTATQARLQAAAS